MPGLIGAYGQRWARSRRSEREGQRKKGQKTQKLTVSGELSLMSILVSSLKGDGHTFANQGVKVLTQSNMTGKWARTAIDTTSTWQTSELG